MAPRTKRIVILLDTTGSMKHYLSAVKEVIQIIYPFLSLLRIEEVIIVVYGDFDNEHKEIDQVVKILKNVTPQCVNNIILNQFGHGGDTVEALNTALFKISEYLQQEPPTPIIVIHDACGHTKLGCVCSSSSGNRDFEFTALARNGIEKSDATTEYFVKELVDNGHLVTCITSNKCKSNKIIYNEGGGYCDIIDPNRSAILAAIFKMLTDILNLSPSTQRTQPMKVPDSQSSEIIWKIDDINLFRKLVLKDGTIMEHVTCLASLYYKAIKDTNNMVQHSEFMKVLSESSAVSAAVRRTFKEAQNELNKEHIKTFQQDTQGPRIIGNRQPLTELLEKLTFTGKTSPNICKIELEKLIKSLEIIDDVEDPRFKDGLPLSVITESEDGVDDSLITKLSLLISYLGRDERNYLVKIYNRPALGLFMACLLRWSPLNKITDVVGHIIKNEDFLQSDKLILSASSYNMSWLLFVVTAFRKIMPDNNMHKLYKMFMLVSILEMSNGNVELTSKLDVKQMTIPALIKYVPGVMMFYCVALRQWYPACLACKCDKSTVKNIITNMKKFNIGTNEYHTALLELCDNNNGYLFLSTYAINFYMDPEYVTELDPFMYKTHTTIKINGELVDCNKSNLNDIYTQLVGENGEHIFENCVPHDDLLYAKNFICTSCGALYGVSDTNSQPIRRCAKCRYDKPIGDDRRPINLIPTYSITCDGEDKHSFVCNYKTSNKVPKKVCPFCNIDLTKCTKTDTYSVKDFFSENIKYVSLALSIPESVLSRLMELKSAYKTAVITEVVEPVEPVEPIEPVEPVFTGNTIFPAFAKWLPIPFSCAHPKGEHIVRIDGCPLTDASINYILSLIINKFNLTCMCCGDKKQSGEFRKVCSREVCIADICVKCVQMFHPCHIGNKTDETVFNGSLSKSVLSCTACRSPINPDANMINFGLMRFIFNSISIKYSPITTSDGATYNSIAAAVFAGVPFWRCSNGPNCLSLRNKTNHGIFEVPKLACDQIDENPHHICEACVQQQMALAKQQAEEARARMLELTPDKDEYGFFIIDGERYRQCPNCKVYTVRTYGCAHMTCACGQHYCYCCGLPHANHGETYAHIRQLFRGEINPRKEQIEEVIRLRKTDPDAILPDTYYGDEETDSDEEYD